MKPPLLSLNPQWVYPKKDPIWLKAIIDEFNIHPVTAQILVARNFTTFDEIHHYLYAQLPDLHDPFLFPDMDKAVERILKAFHKNENILIFGDNDVDGITGAALLTEFIKYIGKNAYFYIPNRSALKKNLILDAIDYASKNKCTLFITVDCGITSIDEIEEALKNKIDVIITDHHEPTNRIPHCIATLNPKLLNSTYPNRELTGVGVAFKLAHALTDKLIKNNEISANKVDLKRYLDLVALGTIADMGALRGENRILVRYGLKQLRKTKRIGLLKLFSVCELKTHEITTNDVASKIAPRLNSLGRIADPKKGIELLLLRDGQAAESLAKELDITNIERQKIERKNSEDIEQYLLKFPEILQKKAIFLYSNKWHPGIIPIITARIAKQYSRPTVIISIDSGIGKGSMRTIPEFPLLPSLKENTDLLLNFGGHDFAAGLTIKEENIKDFEYRFIEYAEKILKDEDLITKLHLDAEVHFKDLTFDFIESLNLLEPFGNENPPPIFYCDAKQTWTSRVIRKKHLEVYLEENDRLFKGIGFGMATKKNSLGKKNSPVRIAFTPQINNFFNKPSIQLFLKDLQLL